MKILLIRERQRFLHRAPLSIGLAQLASLVKQKPIFICKGIDNNSPYKRYEIKEILRNIIEEKAQIIGINVTLFGAYETYKLVKKIKENLPEITIMGGGIHSDTNAVEMLNFGFDIVFKGEAEKSLMRFLDKAKSTINLNNEITEDKFLNINGILYKNKNGKIVDTGASEIVNELDNLPFPDFSIFNLNDFIKNKYDHHYLTNIINGQRGCPFNCIFCKDINLGTKVRENSAEYLFEYSKFLTNFSGINHINFFDNNFTLNKRRVINFCETLINYNHNSKNKITFSCQTNSKSPLDEDLIKLMSHSNSTVIGLGIERLSNKGLDLIRKPQNLDIIFNNIFLLKKYNIVPSLNFLYGFDFDTLEILEEESKMLNKLSENNIIFNINIVVPVPGTAIFNKDYHKEWYLKDEIMNFTPAYYHLVYRFINNADTVNFFNIDKKILNKIISMKEYFLLQGIKKFDNELFKIFLPIDIFLAKCSKYLYRKSCLLEDLLFKIFKKLKFYFENKIILKAVFGESS